MGVYAVTKPHVNSFCSLTALRIDKKPFKNQLYSHKNKKMHLSMHQTWQYTYIKTIMTFMTVSIPLLWHQVCIFK